ncbi:hypothetical protein EXIGLDRAFT_717899, partial [Exidia glandulosa HHB12029]
MQSLRRGIHHCAHRPGLCLRTSHISRPTFARPYDRVVLMSTAAQLPPELLGTAIGFLKQPDVLRAAAVCAPWRKEARHSSNYYQHIQYGTHFNWEAPGCSDLPVVADAKSFALAMQTAEGDDSISRLSVAICIAFHYTIEDHEWFADLDGSSDNILGDGKYRSLGGLVYAFIAPSLHKCMGKIHRLDIDAGGSFFQEMSPSL